MNLDEQRRRHPRAQRYPYHTLDFPYQRDLDSYVTRRDYLRLLVFTSFGLFLGTAAIAAVARLPRQPAPPLRVAGIGDIPEGEALQFHYPTPDDPAILIHLPGGRFVAYSQLCTHLACAVLWDSGRRVLECPCHEGFFDPETGRVLAGPPPRPLPRIDLRIEGQDLIAFQEV
ncbi:MAG: ubiquinol-cytochrome c reductase iron-sulfur subunit [Sphingomonadaceae bacterium]